MKYLKVLQLEATSKQSILHKLNKIKDTLVIQESMTNVNVVMIPKQRKQVLHDIVNQIGIFLLSVLRTILMKLLLKDEYRKFDTYDVSAGERKGRRSQDHLFIINGIIFEHACI